MGGSAFGATPIEDIAREIVDKPRRGTVTRKTRETDISVAIDLDRETPVQISTGIGFFDHMLDQIGKHAGIDLKPTTHLVYHMQALRR